jgi:hypothetical protein
MFVQVQQFYRRCCRRLMIAGERLIAAVADTNVSANYRKKIKNGPNRILNARGKLIDGKNLKSKISCQAPLNSPQNAKKFEYLHQTVLLHSPCCEICIERYYFAHFTELSRVETLTNTSCFTHDDL